MPWRNLFSCKYFSYKYDKVNEKLIRIPDDVYLLYPDSYLCIKHELEQKEEAVSKEV